MRKFNVWHLAMLFKHLNESERFAARMCELDRRDDKVDEGIIRGHAEPNLLMARDIAQQIYLRSTWDRVWDNGPFSTAVGIGLTYQEFQNQLIVLRETIEADLEEKTFAFVLPEKASLLDRVEQDWQSVWAAIPDAKRDIKEACDAYALEQNTSAVFHLMRVAEWGLRAFCHHLGFKNVKSHRRSGRIKLRPIEYSQWEDILRQLRDKTNAKLDKLKRGPRKQQLQEFYHPALSEIEAFKDAWRNHVMHTRRFYEPEDALAVMAHVKRFMNLLVSNGVTKV